MLNQLNFCKLFFSFIFLLASPLHADAQQETAPSAIQDHKTHVVVAMPFKPNMPFDPHWYSPAYVDYIASLLPSSQYNVTGYFVSLENIPQFLDDMQTLYNQEKNICIFNVCDGGEWDGYPGISVLHQWEKHPVSRLIPMTGANAQFIFNSDDKTTMNEFVRQANLRYLPQTLVRSQAVATTDYATLIATEHLDQYWPLFCKLNIGAGALGIGPESICHNIEELTAQMQKMHTAFPSSDLIIQPYLPGPEYTILVVKDRVYAGVQRDYHNIYNIMLEDYVLGGARDISEEITFLVAPQHVQDLALKAVQAIPGKHQYTRVDLRNDAKGNTYVIDINDRPGFGNPSTMNYLLEFNHITPAQFMRDLIETCKE